MNHTHKYVRIYVGRNKRVEYKCALPGCVHKVRAEYIVGRISLCNRCEKEFVLDKENVRLAKPHCLNCTKTKKEISVSAVADYLASLVGDSNDQ